MVKRSTLKNVNIATTLTVLTNRDLFITLFTTQCKLLFRCKCNGHARSCSIGLDSRMKCDCEHNTKGPDCGACLDGSELWHRATYSNGFECQNRG